MISSVGDSIDLRGRHLAHTLNGFISSSVMMGRRANISCAKVALEMFWDRYLGDSILGQFY